MSLKFPLRLTDVALGLFALALFFLCRNHVRSRTNTLRRQATKRRRQRMTQLTGDEGDKGAQAKASGKPLFLKLKPQDDGQDLPRAIFQHPDNFTPERDDDGRVRAWGIFPPYEEDTVEEEMQRKVYRRFKDQSMYGGIGPEYQFVKALVKRKVAALETINIGDLDKSDYILKVQLKSTGGEPGAPICNVWRRVRLSGGLSLGILADKIVTPLMGWTRNYHAHIFTDYNDGALFGPKDCASPDMVHLAFLGYEYIPEARWKVAHLLPKVGDIIGWRYDFGDNWEHTIEVETIFPVEESNGKVEVLDGFGACPAEDCRGMGWWCEIIEHLRTGWRSQKRTALSTIEQSSNYKGKGLTSSGTFDTDRFNLEEATAAVKDALSLPGSFRAGSRHVSMPLVPGGPTMGDFDRQSKKKKQHMMKTDLGNGSFLEESTTSRRDGVSACACSNCGTPHDLKLDLKCRAVYYCGTECQHAHWATRHKNDCKRLAKEGLDTRASTSV